MRRGVQVERHTAFAVHLVRTFISLGIAGAVVEGVVEGAVRLRVGGFSNENAAGQGVVVKPVIYTTTCESCNFNSTVAAWLPWIANPSGEAAQTGSPWDFTSCGSCDVWGTGAWTVWQYDWNGVVSGIPGIVDRDAFNGNSSTLVATLVATSTSNTHINPCTARTSDGRLEVFSLGTDGVSYHNWKTAANGQTTWAGWSSLGGNWAADAKTVVGTDQNGFMELFLIGSTGNLYHNYQHRGG